MHTFVFLALNITTATAVILLRPFVHAIDAGVRIATDALQCLGLVFALAREYTDDGDTLDLLSAVAIMLSSSMGLVKAVYVMRQMYVDRCGGVRRTQETERPEPTPLLAIVAVEMAVIAPCPPPKGNPKPKKATIEEMDGPVSNKGGNKATPTKAVTKARPHGRALPQKPPAFNDDDL